MASANFQIRRQQNGLCTYIAVDFTQIIHNRIPHVNTTKKQKCSNASAKKEFIEIVIRGYKTLYFLNLFQK